MKTFRPTAALIALTLLAGVLALAPTGAGAADSSAPAMEYTPLDDWWGTNGRVSKILPAPDGRVYLAGSFDYVGPTTGYGVDVDGASGAAAAGQPLVDGIVNDAVSDGSGGWFLVGDFKYVEGQFRKFAAHLRADGSVDSWNPKPDKAPEAVTRVGSTVFLGGDFTRIRSTSALGLAAVDAASGNLVGGFPTTNGAVHSLVTDGTSVFAGGAFTSVGGTSADRLARIDASSGAVSSWAGTSGTVVDLALTPDGSTLYAVGGFSSVTGSGATVGRDDSAAIATATGAVRPWAPTITGEVRAVAVDPAGPVYLGGDLSTVGGLARADLAVVDGQTGAVLPGDFDIEGCNEPHSTKSANKNPRCTPSVDALAVGNGLVYVGGRFSRAGGEIRHDAVAFRLGTGALTGWDPVPSDQVLALAVDPGDGSVFVGGDFTSVGGLVRSGVAALDAATGVGVPAFRADADDMVTDLDLSPDGRTLYMGGSFREVGGEVRRYVAAYDTATDTLASSWSPRVNNQVLELETGPDGVYIVGKFKNIRNGGAKTSRLHVAKLDLVTGDVMSFRADTEDTAPAGTRLRRNGMVQTLEVSPDGSKVYFAGPFDTVNGVTQPGLAVVDGTTGALLPHQLGGLSSCWANGRWAVDLYLSPDGQRLYGGDVCPDYFYQWDAVNLSASKPNGLNWVTWCNAGQQAALEVGDRVYYGSHGGSRSASQGGFCQAEARSTATRSGPVVDVQRHIGFAVDTGKLLTDQPTFDTPMGVWSYARLGDLVLVGGDFRLAGDRRNLQQGLAAFPPADPCPRVTEIEAENGVLAGDFTYDADSRASGQFFAQVPGSGTVTHPNPSTATYCFDVTEAGSYAIEAQVAGQGGNADSFYVSVDGGPVWEWHIPSTTAGYLPARVTDGAEQTPVTVDLSRGEHTVTVTLRERGARLDSIGLVPADGTGHTTPG